MNGDDYPPPNTIHVRHVDFKTNNINKMFVATYDNKSIEITPANVECITIEDSLPLLSYVILAGLKDDDRTSIVKQLFEMGVNPNGRKNTYKYTLPLVHAIKLGQIGVVRLLLDHKNTHIQQNSENGLYKCPAKIASHSSVCLDIFKLFAIRGCYPFYTGSFSDEAVCYLRSLERCRYICRVVVGVGKYLKGASGLGVEHVDYNIFAHISKCVWSMRMSADEEWDTRNDIKNSV